MALFPKVILNVTSLIMQYFQEKEKLNQFTHKDFDEKTKVFLKTTVWVKGEKN